MENTAKQATQACPACGEEILAIAKKCKHCGEWLTADGKPETQRVSDPFPPPDPGKTVLFFWLGSLIGISAWLFLVIGAVRRLNNRHVTEQPIDTFIIGVLVISAIVAILPGIAYWKLLKRARSQSNERRFIAAFAATYGFTLSILGYYVAIELTDSAGGSIIDPIPFVVATLVTSVGATLAGRLRSASVAAQPTSTVR